MYRSIGSYLHYIHFLGVFSVKQKEVPSCFWSSTPLLLHKNHQDGTFQPRRGTGKRQVGHEKQTRIIAGTLIEQFRVKVGMNETNQTNPKRFYSNQFQFPNEQTSKVCCCWMMVTSTPHAGRHTAIVPPRKML